MAIPKFPEEFIHKAIRYIAENGVPNQNRSTKYELVMEDGKKYPPKYVIAVAAKLATGKDVQPGDYNAVEAKGYFDDFMEKVMKSVNEHLDDSDFTVDVLATDVGMSRVQLHRKIKEVTGISTGKFIRNIRMKQAGRLIKEGRINIADVAYKVGFNDQTYFSTVFKQYYGVPPSEYGK